MKKNTRAEESTEIKPIYYTWLPLSAAYDDPNLGPAAGISYNLHFQTFPYYFPHDFAASLSGLLQKTKPQKTRIPINKCVFMASQLAEWLSKDVGVFSRLETSIPTLQTLQITSAQELNQPKNSGQTWQQLIIQLVSNLSGNRVNTITLQDSRLSNTNPIREDLLSPGWESKPDMAIDISNRLGAVHYNIHGFIHINVREVRRLLKICFITFLAMHHSRLGSRSAVAQALWGHALYDRNLNRIIASVAGIDFAAKKMGIFSPNLRLSQFMTTTPSPTAR